jgi:hypothetical protein
MLALRHFFRLLGDLIVYSWVNEVFWPLPVVVILVLLGILAFTAQVATPYIYTLF